MSSSTSPQTQKQPATRHSRCKSFRLSGWLCVCVCVRGRGRASCMILWLGICERVLNDRHCADERSWSAAPLSRTLNVVGFAIAAPSAGASPFRASGTGGRRCCRSPAKLVRREAGPQYGQVRHKLALAELIAAGGSRTRSSPRAPARSAIGRPLAPGWAFWRPPRGPVHGILACDHLRPDVDEQELTPFCCFCCICCNLPIVHEPRP